MDDEIHFCLIDGDTTASCNLSIGAQSDQRTFDVAGSFSALGKVPRFDRISKDESRPFRNNIFEKMAGAVPTDFLFLIVSLQSHKDAARDITFGDHANDLVVFIHNRQTPQTLLSKRA